MSATANIVPEILTPEEVAELLRVQPSFVYEKCRRRAKNPLPAHRIGKYLRFERSEVLNWWNGTLTAATTKKRGRR